ncbi:hypothetical protein DFJ73DRAFT_771472 [Zopfochytrium polystomum]|nr:hypothetical protein DFJ73DRAFT_771472 [Zopfochytrium polystomum]
MYPKLLVVIQKVTVRFSGFRRLVVVVRIADQAGGRFGCSSGGHHLGTARRPAGDPVAAAGKASVVVPADSPAAWGHPAHPSWSGEEGQGPLGKTLRAEDTEDAERWRPPGGKARSDGCIGGCCCWKVEGSLHSPALLMGEPYGGVEPLLPKNVMRLPGGNAAGGGASVAKREKVGPIRSREVWSAAIRPGKQRDGAGDKGKGCLSAAKTKTRERAGDRSYWKVSGSWRTDRVPFVVEGEESCGGRRATTTPATQSWSASSLVVTGEKGDQPCEAPASEEESADRVGGAAVKFNCVSGRAAAVAAETVSERRGESRCEREGWPRERRSWEGGRGREPGGGGSTDGAKAMRGVDDAAVAVVVLWSVVVCWFGDWLIG